MLQQSQPPVESRSAGARAITISGEAATGGNTSRPARQAVHWHARQARRGEVELHLLGQEREVAGEIRVQLLAGLAHPQRSSGAACEQEQRPRQRLGAPRKPRGGSGTPPATQPAQPSETSANSGAQAPSPTRAGSTLGDTYDEKLGEVFKARIDDLLKQSN